jgi:hypothetical protein
MFVGFHACGFACAMERYRSERLVRASIGYRVNLRLCDAYRPSGPGVSGLASRLALAGHSIRTSDPEL